MNVKKQKSRLEVLMRLSEDEDSIVAALSDALLPAISDPYLDSNSKETLDVRERISAMARILASERRAASAIVEALLRIEKEMSEANVSTLPWATRLTPLAVECAINAEIEFQRDKIEIELRECSPIFKLDDKTVMAVPIGNLGRESLFRIADRISTYVARQRTKRVILVLEGLATTPDSTECWSALKDDLDTRKIRLEIMGGEKTS